MNPGKLPLEVLTDLLSDVDVSDPRVALGPQPGEDAALIDFGDRYLVAKTDPITFATDAIGWYMVNVNANDLGRDGSRSPSGCSRRCCFRQEPRRPRSPGYSTNSGMRVRSLESRWSAAIRK